MHPRIRRALGDDDLVLRTVPRRGYRLGACRAGVRLPPRSPPSRSRSPRRPERQRNRPGRRDCARIAIAAATLILVAAAVAAGGWRRRPAGRPRQRTAGHRRSPFDNLGDDPGEIYFADGITEDLITDLSKISGIFVIARNSVWAYLATDQSISRAVGQGTGCALRPRGKRPTAKAIASGSTPSSSTPSVPITCGPTAMTGG